MSLRVAPALLFALAFACGGGGSGSAVVGAGGDGGPVAPPETVRQWLLAVIAQDSRLAAQRPLAPDDYDALAAKLANVPGVAAADYVGDTLGTIRLKLTGGGVLAYRHVVDDLELEAAMLPAAADFANQKHPRWNSGWRDPLPPPPVRAIDAAASNTWATHFPVASAQPDPDYTADDAVTCPAEGKIAVVDFLWTEGHRDFPALYQSQFVADGVPLYERLRRMAVAGGFGFDVFRDDELNLGNLTKLQPYTIIMTNGHGQRPGTKSAARLGSAQPALATPEIYDPKKLTAWGTTYESAWKAGEILWSVNDGTILWTPLLFRNHYRPSGPQLVMLGEAWAMGPFAVGLDRSGTQWTWQQGVTSPLYDFGDALMETGAKAVVGFVSPVTPEAVVSIAMPFFRRIFGAYSAKDRPPPPASYWPTCAAAQGFFRLPGSTLSANRQVGPAVTTMYAGNEDVLLRAVCPGVVPHPRMQEYVLRAGIPATAFHACWDRWWSQGQLPSGLQDPVCSQGDDVTTLALTGQAACAVKLARKVTNAMLTP